MQVNSCAKFETNEPLQVVQFCIHGQVLKYSLCNAGLIHFLPFFFFTETWGGPAEGAMGHDHHGGIQHGGMEDNSLEED